MSNLGKRLFFECEHFENDMCKKRFVSGCNDNGSEPSHCICECRIQRNHCPSFKRDHKRAGLFLKVNRYDKQRLELFLGKISKQEVNP